MRKHKTKCSREDMHKNLKMVGGGGFPTNLVYLFCATIFFFFTLSFYIAKNKTRRYHLGYNIKHSLKS